MPNRGQEPKGNEMSKTFELLVIKSDSNRESTVLWNGTDGVDAANNYVAEHGGATVLAWRNPVHPVTVLTDAGRIIG